METKSLYRKINSYLNILEQQCKINLGRITDIGILPCEYKTGNELPPANAFVPYDENGTWGTGINSHAWFRFCTEPTDQTENQPLLLTVTTDRVGWDAGNPQFVVYVDGELYQGMDVNHTELLLDPSQSHELYFYAFTGSRTESAKFLVNLYRPVPSVQKLWYDIKVPFECLAYLEEYSHDYQTILYHLDEALLKLDLFCVPSEAFYQSVGHAGKYMDEIFYGTVCGQREDKPTTVRIGHTHIDCAWQWTLKQTREKVQRSFSTVLRLMERYPEYRFMSSQALLYKYLKEESPQTYAKVKKLIKEGKWECEGSMWVEADCNLVSGESLVRQVMFGKRFFKDEFDVDTKILWLPDVFGYSAALPQILKKSVVDWFLTSKISWNDTNRMPYDTFDWQGLDGTRIHSYFLTAQDKKLGEAPVNYATYVAHNTPAMAAGTYERYQQKMLSNEVLLTFGYGDGGGGPHAAELEYQRRLSHGLPGTPATKMEFAGDFLKRLGQKIEGNPRLPVWQGELYLEYHRATYTTQCKNKKQNRQSEFLYLNTEWICELTKLLCETSTPKAELNKGWEILLTNQFHDIIPGSSIKDVYDQSDIDYAKARAIAMPRMEKAKNLIASSIDKNCGWVVFNPNPATGYGTVTLPDGTCGYVENIPAKGYSTVAKVKSSNTIKVGRNTMENKFFKLTFDGNMMLSSVYDKKAVREVLTEGQKGNELRIYSDYPDLYDAWEWTEYSLESYIVINQLEKAEAVQDGVRSGLRITRHHQKSVIEQTIWLYDDIDRIDFDTRIDWHQQHQMLKVAFPVDIHSDYATYDIQYGNIQRPTHKNTSWDAMKFEVCGHKFADLSEGNYGVTMFNDCKYGHDIHDGMMILSLIRGSTFPDPEADQGEMTCTYSIRPHMGALDLPKTSAMAYNLNNPLQILRATGDSSVLPKEFFVVKSDKENIFCEVVKEAEDSNALILRLYEIKNAKTCTKLTFGFDVASVALCDMLEREIKPLPVQNNTVDLPFGTFEIHTLKVLPASKQ